MNWFKRLFIVDSIKRLFKKCDHDWEFVRNIYGDQINYCNGKRSKWKCKKCGKIEFRDDLYS